MITLEQKQEVVRMRNEGCSFKLIANTLDVGRLQVRDFCRTITAKEMGLKDNIETVYQVSYTPPKVYQCVNCNNDYIKRESDLNSVSYCSKECKEKAKLKRIEEKKKSCLKCNKTFLAKANQIYCSAKCRTITKECEVCGEEFSRPNKKMYRRQKTCSVQCASEMTSRSHEEYYKLFSAVHKGLLVPVQLYTRADDLITCLCLKCGEHTTREADKFINGRKLGCKHCGRVYSKGELIIDKWLKDNNIPFAAQYSVDGLVNSKSNSVRFDFAVFNQDESLKLLIEFDGKQHFEPVQQFGGQEYLEEVKHTDLIKNNYCEENNIDLIRISYKQQDNIVEILEKMEW